MKLEGGCYCGAVRYVSEDQHTADDLAFLDLLGVDRGRREIQSDLGPLFPLFRFDEHPVASHEQLLGREFHASALIVNGDDLDHPELAGHCRQTEAHLLARLAVLERLAQR